ncbi:type II toxin-antitoxin system death-on-curing family toxin [Jannaschia sp. CCS1]|uniref:type II toxin-antitoxin system death-on-curing family toxin n=1 Tax=Jannaschia sp. (strain CCS1) TaxID=290400 RepID=UPI000053DA47|nr:type II toxin-antitoxin system death-on-curing family toxin [Jannaschia sp. CCS1]ABD56370.1 Death-on-curing protein [Jannaschia sp. CCS1]
MSWVWVPVQTLYVVHDRQIARHGGAPGVRDIARLATACAPTQSHGASDIQDIAAAYAFGIAKAHAFVDGNKRTAFVACATFLRLNGWSLRPDPAEGVRMMEDLAASRVSDAEFAEWLKRQSNPL